MAQLPSAVNLVILSGQVDYVKVFDKGRHVVLILACQDGRFYVDYTCCGDGDSLQVGDQVMVKGSLFTRRGRDGLQASRIRAEEITRVRSE
jgi:hypothetical protein